MHGGRNDLGDGAEKKPEGSLARRMLKGIKAPDRPEPVKEERHIPSDVGPDILNKLVNAMKNAPGRISGVEPEGYGHLVCVRIGGDFFGLGARGDAIDALQLALRKAGVSNVP